MVLLTVDQGLCLLIFSAGFRRFALWGSAVVMVALICGFFYSSHVEQQVREQVKREDVAREQRCQKLRAIIDQSGLERKSGMATEMCGVARAASDIQRIGK